MPEHEDLKDGAVFCKIDKRYVDKMQVLANQKIAIRQFLGGLLRDQAEVINAENQLWEEIKKEYLLDDHTVYFIDFRTRELKVKRGILNDEGV
jgi:hypothetical protein